ncbi:MAG: FtsX-like permease family protein [Bacteroidota bacterium]
MNFSLYIAGRYLKSKKTHNIINFITGIAATGIAVGTFALIVVLSVFNGFESLVVKLFNYFNPDILITATYGKTFHLDNFPQNEIKKIPGVYYFNEVVEENALAKYHDKQYIIILKGINKDFARSNRIDTMTIDGNFVLEKGDNNFAVLGSGVAYYLDVNLNDFTTPLTIYVPRRTKVDLQDPSQAFNQENIYPSAVFSIQQDFDARYILAPLRFVRKMLNYKDEVSFIEISLSKDANPQIIKKQLEDLLGNTYTIKTRFQQQEVLYKIMVSEKFVIFLILSFILLIAAFNIIGSLTMLTIDKKKDIIVLRSLGAGDRLIKNIFLYEGLLISTIGGIAGMLIGAIVCVLQKTFGLVKINSGEGTFVVNNYPVDMQITDFGMVFIIVVIIGFLASWITVKRISSKYINEKL